ncbi:FadR/GntR family transcriptional regulator [Brevibacterium aurantiacum]|uniref:FadR/GntR family transcriptional regulator n=1 Tax=Brevibacterium aurantiacum TaxID=273384 RepID=UPI002163EF88|nr:winged helix-turn-helix domain-containing protein [Brevibacterium aurantiacum]
MPSESVRSSDDIAAGHAPKAPQAPEWKPVSRSSTHELVINAIEEQITSGYLTVGDPLPSERDLAAKLQVSRAPVREAVRRCASWSPSASSSQTSVPASPRAPSSPPCPRRR